MNKTIAFDVSRWGHALHGWTMREKRAEKRKDRVIDMLKGRRRYTVLAHSSEYPCPGDRISYETERGVVTPLVVDVTCVGPSDMFRLEILFEKNQ